MSDQDDPRPINDGTRLSADPSDVKAPAEEPVAQQPPLLLASYIRGALSSGPGFAY
ncbi:MAG TPA: hypothetical protein VLF67_03705 [Candidatus Saccharimonas sp.]|nr:hypothetical protein [Candidatus Saccharimonas sp.]